MATDEQRMHRAIELAHEARKRGDRPYGAVLIDASGVVLAEGMNGVDSEADLASHAELNALRAAARRLGDAALAGGTMYASGEPCAMCAGALVRARIGRVVFAASAAMAAPFGPPDAVQVSCRDVLRLAPTPIDVVGPFLDPDEALAPFRD